MLRIKSETVVNNELLDINWSEPFELADPTSEDAIPEIYMQCLQKCFGHTRFREMQWKVISSILDGGRDNCVIMATGYGKSLCYQFPSVYRDTITIVVSPLISLMQDQVQALLFYKLKACFLGSAQTNRDTVYEVIDRKYNIVYVTPEYITSEAGTFLLERIRDHLTLIAIDEAHCISKWGHDFRQAYRKLDVIRDICPMVPILAMTATATARVRADIIDNLKLSNPQIVCTGFDRPNLEFIVKQKTDAWADIGPYIEKVKIGSVIVYCISRRTSEEVATVIEAHGHLCGVYHAGRSLKQRQKAHSDFIHDRVRVVVATIAFGMGINKPDVRLVIHYGVAKDVEGYYQEVGRAGRDGLPAKCLMFYRPKDWAIHRMIRDRCQLRTTKEHMEALTMAMAEYVDTTDCRRRFILSYFGEDCSRLQLRRDCCDNCRRDANALAQSSNQSGKYHGLDDDGLLDITDESFKILTLLNNTLGIGKVILVLRGSKSKSMPAHFYFHPFYGSLKDKSEKWLSAVNKLLLQMRMLTMIQISPSRYFPYPYNKYTVSSKGKLWLDDEKRDPIKIVPGEEFIRLLKPKVLSAPKILQPAIVKPSEAVTADSAEPSSAAAATTSNKSLSDIYRPLVKVRSKLAGLYDAMPYLVASTRALQQLARLQPTTMDELRKIRLDGYSDEKTERFGPVFLKVIKDYQAKFGKIVQLEQQPPQQQETQLVDETPITIDMKPKLEANTNHQPPSEIVVISDDSDGESNTEAKTLTNGVAIQPSAPENGEGDECSNMSQGSVEVIEPTPPPLVVIDSDNDNTAFVDWDSEPDVKPWDVKVEMQVSDSNNELDSDNSELNRLIEYLKSEDKDQMVCDKPSTSADENGLSIKQENENDCLSDIFDGDWDFDVDETELSQVSELAEQKYKCQSEERPAPEAKLLPSQPIIKEEKTEENSINTVAKLDLNQNCSTQCDRKPRIIRKKISEPFEYEDDIDSESEAPVFSPKKRILPSWMQLSNKKPR